VALAKQQPCDQQQGAVIAVIVCCNCIECCLPSHCLLTPLMSPKHDCAYCRQCFAEWWHWQQSSMQHKAGQIQKDLQSAAPQRLQDEGLVPDADGLFAVQCPVCR